MLMHSFSACPLCDTPIGSADLVKTADASSHPSYKPDLPPILRWLRCRSCAHVFTDSYRTELGDRVLFSSALPHQVPNTAQSEHQRNLWAPTVHRVARHLDGGAAVFGATGASRPRWADIGSGGGGLVMTADEFGFAAVGVDVRSEAVTRLQDLGYDAICSTFEDLAFAEPLAVLSMADVLEHMPEPRPALDKARSMLLPDGLLYISCPNSEASTWRSWEQTNTNPYWAEIEHYHNFSRTKLVELLDAHGFRVVDYYVSARYYACMEVIARRAR